eukprot:COSAG02_NODE_4857_length_4897_cov_5.098166_5_plen_31_part_00
MMLRASVLVIGPAARSWTRYAAAASVLRGS